MTASIAGWIVTLYALGLVLPVGALIVAYFRVTASHRRSESIREFRRGENAWHAAEMARLDALPFDPAAREALQAAYDKRAHDAGMPIVTVDEFAVDLGLPPSGELSGAVYSARFELLVVGIGLACATAASIWSAVVSIG